MQHTTPAASGIHHHHGKPAAALAPTVVSTATDVAVPDVPVAVALTFVGAAAVADVTDVLCEVTRAADVVVFGWGQLAEMQIDSASGDAAGVGAGDSRGVGSGEGCGVGSGVSPGDGARVGAGDGLGVGAGVFGTGVGAGEGAGVGCGVGAGEGAGVGFGVGLGVGRGVGLGVGLGDGRGVGLGVGRGAGKTSLVTNLNRSTVPPTKLHNVVAAWLNAAQVPIVYWRCTGVAPVRKGTRVSVSNAPRTVAVSCAGPDSDAVRTSVARV